MEILAYIESHLQIVYLIISHLKSLNIQKFLRLSRNAVFPSSSFLFSWIYLYNHYLFPFLSETREDYDDKQVVTEIMARCFIPTLITTTSWESFYFIGHEIRITEAMDCYGAVVWPSALVLCYFLETNAKQYNMVDKNVIEIGAGTGLVSIVASLLVFTYIKSFNPHYLSKRWKLCYPYFTDKETEAEMSPGYTSAEWQSGHSSPGQHGSSRL
ncbi:protein-lysine methyltransferase METTL21E isoform X5 [Nomascus leucogenys]|uniref:protein-lysine methyltransferase METTL21E isoform X5 n=1 Tax=Nomascus leucogenys TaxID=61853 RepID=UPI00122D7CB7|nr:protein-lysine methyltransferase METTL21E isoform X5 [Nomascus leucogenys]